MVRHFEYGSGSEPPLGQCSEAGHCFKVSLLYKNNNGVGRKRKYPLYSTMKHFLTFYTIQILKCSHPRI